MAGRHPAQGNRGGWAGKMTLFSQKIYALAAQIPKGKVTTYKLLAKKLHTKAYRAVGNAIHKNPYWPKVPCHRVVKSNGQVGGFASGTKKKIALLKKEGIMIKNGKVVDFESKIFRF
jgi:methylated-DNA-[protein]-cysteine S-methyltransferase